MTDRPQTSRTSAAERHRREAHSQVHTNLRVMIEAGTDALDWAQSWPNSISNLEKDLDSILNKLRALDRAVKPPEYMDRSQPSHVSVLRIDDDGVMEA